MILISGFHRSLRTILLAAAIGLALSACATPGPGPAATAKDDRPDKTGPAGKAAGASPAASAGSSGTKTAKTPANQAGSTKPTATGALKTTRADYSRKDLLYVQGFGDGNKTLVSWMVGRETLKTQKIQTMDQLLSGLDIERFKSLAIRYGEDRWHASFVTAGFEVLSVDTETYGPRQDGTARNDWIIVVSLKEKDSDFNERVPFLPDGTLILSSMD